MANFVRKTSCELCGSKDNRAEYDDGSWYCFGICQRGGNYPKDASSKRFSALVKSDKEKGNKLKEPITEEKKEEIKSYTYFDNTGYRGIHKETNTYFGVRYAYNSNGGVEEVYYPMTKDSELVGYKVREIPKIFTAIGLTGNDVDLFGAFRFRNGGKYVLITEGEHDALAAYQMFKEYNDSRGGSFTTAVVSITTGAGNPAKQLQNNYDFLNKFENIVVGFDADEVGEAAIEKIVNCLPKGKIRIARWTKFKDPNEYLINDKAQHFLNDFYSAKPYVPAGVVASSELYDKIIQQSSIQKVTLPPFAKRLEEMLGGGLILGHIYNIAAQTGIGKTSVVNEFIYHWIFNSPHLIGVVSMELNAGQYGEALLSRHIQQKLARLDTDNKIDYLNTDKLKEKGRELFCREDGSPRFYLVEDRDGTVEQLQAVVEEMVIGSGVKIVVLDVLQDIIEGMTNEEQGLFMKWCKSMIKSHGISFVLINHMRKTSAGTNSADVSENDIHGSSTIMKSSSANILLTRDKNAEDPVVRNTTEVTLSKNRVLGDTGPAGSWYYDSITHVLHDSEEYWSTRERPTPVQSNQNQRDEF